MNTKAPPITRQPHTLLAHISLLLLTDFTGHPGTTIRTQMADLTADEKSIIVSHLIAELDGYPGEASNDR